MLSVIAPIPLAVEEKDFILVGICPKGSHVYFNTRWVKENQQSIFDGESYGTAMIALKNEISRSNEVKGTVCNWVGEESLILTLSLEEVPEFVEFYKLTKKDSIFQVLAGTPYDETASVSEVILQQSLDIMIKLYRKSLGGK